MQSHQLAQVPAMTCETWFLFLEHQGIFCGGGSQSIWGLAAWSWCWGHPAGLGVGSSGGETGPRGGESCSPPFGVVKEPCGASYATACGETALTP